MSQDKLQRAIAAHQAGRIGEAEPLYQQCIRETNNYTAKQLLGLLYSSQQRDDLAIPLMQSSLNDENKQPAVHNNLANCLKRVGQIDAAAEHYVKAIELNRDYVDAYRNLASLWLAQGDLERAGRIVRNGLKVVPREPTLMNVLGLVQQAQRQFTDAIASFNAALESRPDFAAAAHNLAVTRRLNDEPGIALDQLLALQSQGIDGFEITQNIGNAYSDLGDLENAEACYRKAIELNPAYADAHHNLANIRWAMDDTAGFLDSYEAAFARGVMTDELVLSYFECLLRAGREQEIPDFLARQNVTDPWDARYCDLLGRAWLNLGDLEKSHHFHARASSFDNAPAEYRINLAVTKLKMARLDEAQALLEAVNEADPRNQTALTYLSLCYRASGHERSAELNDYGALVGEFDLPVDDPATFNAALTRCLDQLHNTTRHPLEQTLRGGTQTQGNLFARQEAEIRELVSAIRAAVSEYLNSLPAHALRAMGFDQHQQFGFSGSWSVRLRSEGFHTMHMHPMGSISSAYYVTLPPVIRDDDSTHAGWIQFGKPNMDFPFDFPAEHFVRPAAGKLVLFPSYMWHGTVPFESDEPRMTCAFDVVPVGGTS